MDGSFALVVDLHPWPEPVDQMVVERLGAPLRDVFGTVRTWHAAREEGDPKGAAAAEDPALGAVVLTGSMAMVEDQTQWMTRLGRAVDAWADRRMPILGTCFGHQFLAHHFGGRLGSFESRRVELAPLHIVDERDPLFVDLPAAPELLWTHRDLVLEVPPELLVTATSDLVPVEALRHRDLPIWGIQAHPEADVDLVKAVARVDEVAAPNLRRRPWAEYATPAAKTVLAQFASEARRLPPPRPA